MLNMDGDLGHHLAMGRLILQSQSIPHTDLFSFRTATIAAIPHEWLVQSIFALLDGWFGLTGIVVFCALLIAAAFTLVLQESVRRSGLLVAGLIVAALALAVSPMHWVTRPHLVTYLLLPIWTYRLDALLRGEERRWWIFPLLMLLWANLHGMFIFGLLVLGIAVVGYGWERWVEKKVQTIPALGRELLLIGVFSVLATFLTPSGWHLWSSILNLAGSSFITSRTLEYRSADFHMPETWPFLILLGLILATSVLAGKKLTMPVALQLAGWTLIGLYSVRNLPLSAIIMAPIGAELLVGWLQGSPAFGGLVRFSRGLEHVEKNLRGWLLAVLGTGIAILLLGWGVIFDLTGKPYQFLPEKFPVAAVDWLQVNPPQGRTFNEFDWGGYLLYRLWPEQKIFMDGHTHIYGDALSREYVSVVELDPGWEAILDKYQIEWVILRSGQPLASALAQAGWQVIYDDDIAVIFQR